MLSNQTKDLKLDELQLLQIENLRVAIIPNATSMNLGKEQLEDGNIGSL